MAANVFIDDNNLRCGDGIGEDCGEGRRVWVIEERKEEEGREEEKNKTWRRKMRLRMRRRRGRRKT